MMTASAVVLAIDTATEQCSVAVSVSGKVVSRAVLTARGHAEMILSMIQDVVTEAGIVLADVDAIAFGRGPGAFTGVRLAVGVTQGLAFALDKPVLPVSNLAAVAHQAVTELSAGQQVLVCMDARMGEVYTAAYEACADQAGFLLRVVSPEQVCAPDNVPLTNAVLGLGTGFTAYPALCARFPAVTGRSALPNAVDILALALVDFAAGKAVPVEQALPVYLRDQVTHVRTA